MTGCDDVERTRGVVPEAVSEFERFRDDLIEFASALVRIQSVTGEEGNAARFVRDRMVALGYDQVSIDDWGNVIGTVGNGPVTVLFDSHLDTVQADRGAGWTRDPFGGEIQDGVLYGRGSVDMKGAVAATVYAGHAMKRLGTHSDKTVVISVSVMEESLDGEALARACTDNDIRPDYAVICEPSRMQLALGHNGRAMLTVTTHGIPAHGSCPGEGVNAVYKMAGIIQAVEALQEEFQKKPQRSGSVALTRIESVSDSLNAVPGKCRVYLDRRTVLGETEETISREMSVLTADTQAQWAIDEVQSLTWTGREIRGRSYYPAWEIAEDHPLVRACEQTLMKLTGVQPEKMLWDFCTNGVTTAGQMNIPTIGIGPGDPRMAHMNDECCSIEEIFTAFVFYALLPECLP